MSDTPLGDGWWQTSDGKWHPPEYEGPTPTSDPEQPPEPEQPPLSQSDTPWSVGAADTPATQGGWGSTTQASEPPQYSPPLFGQPATDLPGLGTGPPEFGDAEMHGYTTDGATDDAFVFEEPPVFEDHRAEAPAYNAPTENAGGATFTPGEFGTQSAPPPRSSQPTVIRTRATNGSEGGAKRPNTILLAALGVVVVIALVVIGLVMRSGGDDKAADGAGSTPSATTATTNPSSSSTTPSTQTTAPPRITNGPRLPVLNFNGTGNATVTIDPPGPRVTNLVHQGPGGFKVQGLDAKGAEVDTLLDTSGPYKGAVAVDFHDDEDTRTLKVTAEGPWQIQMFPVEALLAEPGAFSGHGDTVMLYSGDVGPVRIAHNGKSKFTVNTFEIKTRAIETLVNEKGPVSETVTLRGPAFVWIRADGDWSVTPQ